VEESRGDDSLRWEWLEVGPNRITYISTRVQRGDYFLSKLLLLVDSNS